MLLPEQRGGWNQQFHFIHQLFPENLLARLIFCPGAGVHRARFVDRANEARALLAQMKVRAGRPSFYLIFRRLFLVIQFQNSTSKYAITATPTMTNDTSSMKTQ